MILVAIANVLKDGVIQTLFHGDSMIQATELLLQERTPRDADRSPPGFDDLPSSAESRDLPAPVPRRFTSPHHVAPRTRSELLCQGAVAGNSRSVYSGLIRVHRGAVRSDAMQTNNNLVLDTSFGDVDAGLGPALRGIPGVIEHGLFFGMAKAAILGSAAGIRILGEL